MKNVTKRGAGLALLLGFSSASFAWGAWSPLITDGGTGYCFATAANGGQRIGLVTQSHTVRCQGDGTCFVTIIGQAVNITPTIENADLSLQVRHKSGYPVLNSQAFDRPAYSDPVTISAETVFGIATDWQSRCRVQ